MHPELVRDPVEVDRLLGVMSAKNPAVGRSGRSAYDDRANRRSRIRKILSTSRKIPAASGMASSRPARRRRLKSTTVYSEKIARPSSDQIVYAAGIRTKMSTNPAPSRASSSQNRILYEERQVAAYRVARRPEPGDEQRGSPEGLAHGNRVGVGVVVDGRRDAPAPRAGRIRRAAPARGRSGPVRWRR